MASKQLAIVYKPDDYKTFYHMSPEGEIWLDAKNRPIPLTLPLTGHIQSMDPHAYWQSRVTRSGPHSLEAPPIRGGVVNSTSVHTEQPPTHTHHLLARSCKHL